MTDRPICKQCKKPLKDWKSAVIIIQAKDVQYAKDGKKWRADSWQPTREEAYHPTCYARSRGSLE